MWKSRFRMETITFLRFFRAAFLRHGPRTTFADRGQSETVAFFQTPSKIFMSGTWNFRIIEKNIKAIFREYFSSLREDSGKIFQIFKLMTFRCGPRTTYYIALVRRLVETQKPSVLSISHDGSSFMGHNVTRWQTIFWQCKTQKNSGRFHSHVKMKQSNYCMSSKNTVWRISTTF